jgi:hypothetical protein
MAKMTLEELVKQLGLVHRTGLRCVALYGSAARGEQVSRHANLNVLVIVDAIDMEHLRREAAVAKAWNEAGHPPPLTMTVAEWQGSADIFPIEYSDILAHHKVLHGALPGELPVIRREDLRLQLEHETRSKLLRLRHAVLSSGADAKVLATVLEESVSSIMVLLRAALRLHGEEPPPTSEAVLDRFEVVSGHSASVFRRVLAHARGEARVTGEGAIGLMADYLGAVSALAAWGNAL